MKPRSQHWLNEGRITVDILNSSNLLSLFNLLSLMLTSDTAVPCRSCISSSSGLRQEDMKVTGAPFKRSRISEAFLTLIKCRKWFIW